MFENGARELGSGNEARGVGESGLQSSPCVLRARGREGRSWEAGVERWCWDGGIREFGIRVCFDLSIYQAFCWSIKNSGPCHASPWAWGQPKNGLLYQAMLPGPSCHWAEPCLCRAKIAGFVSCRCASGCMDNYITTKILALLSLRVNFGLFRACTILDVY